MSILISFQLGKTVDSQGRTINDIWAFNDFWLEHDHSYIQWLFPIDSQTKFNRHAPILTTEDISAFRQFDSLKEAQLKSLSVMLGFLGMQWQGDEIIPTPILNIRDHIWLKHGGHNHLRISRIIRSLALCGQLELSELFQQAMLDAAKQYGEVSEESKAYWIKANTI
ncbi:hypothetical protein JFQ72_004389 [Vibrio parahaemolyticus]|nr:hypothetical protein [Vibrio parahaemolyticus]